jgi:hypothetical protein
MVSEFSNMEDWHLASSELSHFILAIAISHVSRTVRSESERNFSKTGTDDRDEMAPIASAACLA